jgi:erythromycin esterase
MFRHAVLAVLVGGWMCSVLVPPASGQSRTERVASLAQNAVPIRSIEPLDEDFTDLEPLRDVMGSARVVLLGEQSHGDGATFLAKARLVRFLHQEMGFDVLAFESGFYECEVAGARMEAGEEADTAVRRCVFPVWAESAEFQPTVDYLEETRGWERPLRIAGFDSQMTGSASPDFLLADLRARTAEAGVDFDWSAFEAILEALVDDRYRAGVRTVLPFPAEETRTTLDDALVTLARDLAESTLEDRSYWSQVIRSFAAHARAVWMTDEGVTNWEYGAARDRQMADNLLWHLDHRHADRKVIVWAASFHTARNLHLIEMEGSDPPNPYGEFRPLGDHLEAVLGPKMYSVGFIAFEGEWGTAWMQPQPVPRGEPETLEAILTDAGFELAFLDLRELDASTAWLRSPITSRPLAYAPMTAPWGQVMDGILFTRQMTPSTRRAP